MQSPRGDTLKMEYLVPQPQVTLGLGEGQECLHKCLGDSSAWVSEHHENTSQDKGFS